MSFSCLLHGICMRLNFIYMYSYVIGCLSHVLVCHRYVICMYSYFIRMSLVCTRMSFVCQLYILICNSYVTRRLSCHEPSKNNTFKFYVFRFLKRCEWITIISIHFPFCDVCVNTAHVSNRLKFDNFFTLTLSFKNFISNKWT